LGINHYEKESHASSAVPVHFRHSCTLHTRHMLLLQKPCFPSPIIHVLLLGIHPDSSDWLYAGTDSLSRMRAVWLGVEHRWLIISGPPVLRCGYMYVLLEAVRTLLLTDYCIGPSHLYSSAALRSTSGPHWIGKPGPDPKACPGLPIGPRLEAR
jgi:hypothetical protein